MVPFSFFVPDGTDKQAGVHALRAAIFAFHRFWFGMAGRELYSAVTATNHINPDRSKA